MNWDITVRPYTSAMDLWSWTAVRADQENSLSGAGYDTEAQARDAAEEAVQGFENSEGVIKAATVKYVFEPVIPEAPAP